MIPSPTTPAVLIPRVPESDGGASIYVSGDAATTPVLAMPVSDQSAPPARILSDPRNIHAHSRNLLIEEIMALEGRSRSNPREYRKWLETLTGEQLAELKKEILEGRDWPQQFGNAIDRMVNPQKEI